MARVSEDSPLLSAEGSSSDFDGDLSIPVPPPPLDDDHLTAAPPPPFSPASRPYHVSSLDFERIVNQYSIQAVREQWSLPFIQEDGVRKHYHIYSERTTEKKRRHLLGYTGRTATRWILTALAGLLTGLTSILITHITGSIVSQIDCP